MAAMDVERFCGWLGFGSVEEMKRRYSSAAQQMWSSLEKQTASAMHRARTGSRVWIGRGGRNAEYPDGEQEGLPTGAWPPGEPLDEQLVLGLVPHASASRRGCRNHPSSA